MSPLKNKYEEYMIDIYNQLDGLWVVEAVCPLESATPSP